MLDTVNPKKSTLAQAVEEALKLSTEAERVLALVGCLKPYRNEYQQHLYPDHFEGYEKCTVGLLGLKRKILTQIADHYEVPIPQEQIKKP